MNKEFVSYEIALALKELGFDEPCMAIYYSKDKSFSWHHHKDHTNDEPALDSGEFNISAPLYQQAFRWFREKYGLYCNFVSEFYSDGINFNWQVMWYIPKEEWTEFHVANGTYWYGDNNEFPTQEEAELACLIKLIEIAKSKNKTL